MAVGACVEEEEEREGERRGRGVSVKEKEGCGRKWREMRGREGVREEASLNVDVSYTEPIISIVFISRWVSGIHIHVYTWFPNFSM